MSTQNILYKEDVIERFQEVLMKQGDKYLLNHKFNVGEFDMKDISTLLRISNIICKDDCLRLPLRASAQELLNTQINKL